MATLYELDDVLHPQVITELYREETGKLFSHPLLDYYGQQAKNYTGDRFEFAYREAMKQPAPASLRGQPARILQPTGLSPRQVYMLHAFNEVSLSLDALQMIRRPSDLTTQEKGREEIVRQMEDFGARHHVFPRGLPGEDIGRRRDPLRTRWASARVIERRDLQR